MEPFSIHAGYFHYQLEIYIFDTSLFMQQTIFPVGPVDNSAAKEETKPVLYGQHDEPNKFVDDGTLHADLIKDNVVRDRDMDVVRWPHHYRPTSVYEFMTAVDNHIQANARKEVKCEPNALKCEPKPEQKKSLLSRLVEWWSK